MINQVGQLVFLMMVLLLLLEHLVMMVMELASGHVRIYKNVNNIWTQVGGDIDGEAAGDLSGYQVSLSSDGSVVAIGAPWNDGNGLVKWSCKNL